MTLAELKKIIQDKYLHYGNFTLSSGKDSAMYFDIKGMILSPEYDDRSESDNHILLNAICDKLYDIEQEQEIKYKSVAGVELGGALIIPQLAYEYLGDCTYCVIRKGERVHGLKKMIEGQPKNPILLVDDVISRGKTIDAAIKTLYADPYGYVPCGVLCVINRSNLEEIIIKDFMETRQIPIYSLFKESDFD